MVTVLVWRVPSRDENFLVVEDRVCSRQWYFVDLCGVSCEMLAVIELPWCVKRLLMWFIGLFRHGSGHHYVGVRCVMDRRLCCVVLC